jgi:hypothetical protein
MTLRIEKLERQGSAVFSLVGRFEAEHIEELEDLLGIQKEPRPVVLDLQEVRLADREAVKFLARCEAVGVQLENCPAYIREWVRREKP